MAGVFLLTNTWPAISDGEETERVDEGNIEGRGRIGKETVVKQFSEGWQSRRQERAWRVDEGGSEVAIASS